MLNGNGEGYSRFICDQCGRRTAPVSEYDYRTRFLKRKPYDKGWGFITHCHHPQRTEEGCYDLCPECMGQTITTNSLAGALTREEAQQSEPPFTYECVVNKCEATARVEIGEWLPDGWAEWFLNTNSDAMMMQWATCPAHSTAYIPNCCEG